jgi:hypothetical protein
MFDLLTLPYFLILLLHDKCIFLTFVKQLMSVMLSHSRKFKVLTFPNALTVCDTNHLKEDFLALVMSFSFTHHPTIGET